MGIEKRQGDHGKHEANCRCCLPALAGFVSPHSVGPDTRNVSSCQVRLKAIDHFTVAGLNCSPMISGIAKKQTTTEAKVRIGGERLLKVSEEAGNKVRSLLERQGRPGGVLRVAVVGGGCSGLQYKLDLQDAPVHRDILVESYGIRVVVDPKTALYVTGSQLDYADKLEDGGFKVNNPNAASTCSCGESFSA